MKYIGRCSDIATLRTIDPTVQGQKIDVVAYHSGWDAQMNPVGGGYFWYDAADNETADNGFWCIVTNNGSRWKRVVASSIINISCAGCRSGDDITTALKNIIAYVKSLVVTQANMNYFPIISIDAGTYIVSEMLEVPSVIKFAANGPIVLDFSGMDVNAEAAFRIYNDETIPNDIYKQPANLAPMFNGMHGTITVLGQTVSLSKSACFKIGNKVAGNANCRDIHFTCVNVRQFDTAVAGVARDLYLLTFDHCRLEGNNRNLSFGYDDTSGINYNSGERIAFLNCVFSGSGNAYSNLYNNIPAIDINFINCSFDYTYGSAIVSLGGAAKYLTWRFVGYHIEYFNGYVVSATDGGESTMITLEGGIILPTGQGTIVPSPSRQLFALGSGVRTSINGLEVRHGNRAYTDDISMLTNDSAGAIDVIRYLKDPFPMLPSTAYILNRGPDFSLDTVGGAIQDSTIWEIYTKASTVTGTIITLNGGQALQLVSTADDGYINLYSKAYIPVQAGNIIGLFMGIQALSATGDKTASVTCTWYDKDLNVISTTSSTTFSFNSAYNDTTLPNYSEGTNRLMASTAVRKTAPAGAVYARARFGLSAFNGTLNVSKLVAFKVI